MSHVLNLAVSLPTQPLLFAGAAALIILIAVVLFVVKSRRGSGDAWADAAEELGVDLVADGSELGPVVRGRVNDHVITVTPVTNKGRRKSTQYGVKFEATEAPQFRLIKRLNGDFPTLDTGNPKFDAVVSIQTDQPTLLGQFLTSSRRAAILRILTYWPDALISNRDVHLVTPGLEDDADAIVDAVCHLVATAETFDRLTKPASPVASESQPESSAAKANPPVEPSEANVTSTPTTEPPEANVLAGASADESAAGAPVAEADADVLTEVRLDEQTVLGELFNTGLMPDQIAALFEKDFKGREVNWSGEVVRVGPPDEQGRQRVAALVGSADGQTAESGRVVALTSVGPDPIVTEGDVVSFSGALVNLDAAQRLFHVV